MGALAIDPCRHVDGYLARFRRIYCGTCSHSEQMPSTWLPRSDVSRGLVCSGTGSLNFGMFTTNMSTYAADSAEAMGNFAAAWRNQTRIQILSEEITKNMQENWSSDIGDLIS